MLAEVWINVEVSRILQEILQDYGIKQKTQ
jgi:hypothetical protein